jgi:hypothetical protein
MYVTIDAVEVATDLANADIEEKFGDIKERPQTDEQREILKSRFQDKYDYYFEMITNKADIKC